MRETGAPLPSGPIVIVRQIEKHEWTLRFPRINEEVDDRLEEGIDWIDADPERAAAIFVELIERLPEHADARHHLALALEKLGKNEEALQIRREAWTTALKFFPPHFSMRRDRLEWGWATNRPLLRLYRSLGLQLLEKKQTEEALEVFEDLLALNPNDNQGARALVVDCHFALKAPEGVLSVCRQFRQDCLPELVYGRPLALFQLGRAREARRALDKAIDALPRIAVELLKARHPKPKDVDERRVSLGGWDAAYVYWQEHGVYWKKTPGALEFLRQAAARIPSEKL